MIFLGWNDVDMTLVIFLPKMHGFHWHLFCTYFQKKVHENGGGRGRENGYRQKNNIIRIVNIQTILFKGLPSTVWQMSGKTQLYIFFSGAFHTTQWVDWIPLSLTSPTYFEGFWIFTLYIWIFYIFLKYGIGWCPKLPPPPPKCTKLPLPPPHFCQLDFSSLLVDLRRKIHFRFY